MRMAPPAGLEPATSWLTVMRSTDWAKEEYKIRRRLTFPGSLPPSIISTAELNFRVRNGNGWDLCVIITGFVWMLVSQHLWSYFCTFKTKQYLQYIFLVSYIYFLSRFFDQALVLLVLVSWIHYCTYTSSLSTTSSTWELTAYAWDILSWGWLHA